jgi:tRNA threonylcarbamoyladenosine biosynthesis protein TsaB
MGRSAVGALSVADGAVTLLAIESATDMVGVGLISQDGGAAERLHFGGRAHAELLVPAIEEVCAVSGCTVADIDRIAVDIGPGLFTGLRVGVATAKALGQALGVKLVGVGSLDVLAAGAAEASGSGLAQPVVSVVDARRGEVFAAAYRFDRPEGKAGQPFSEEDPIDPAAVRDERLEPMSPETLVAWLLELGGEADRVLVVGDGAIRYRQLLSVHPGLDLSLASDLSAPPPLALARLAQSRLARGIAPVAPEAVVPDYRRAADARINWEQRPPRSSDEQGTLDEHGTSPT